MTTVERGAGGHPAASRVAASLGGAWSCVSRGGCGDREHRPSVSRAGAMARGVLSYVGGKLMRVTIFPLETKNSYDCSREGRHV